MSFEIICPYCFRKMRDDEVLFRSERISDPNMSVLPEPYEDDIEKFIARYDGPNKELYVEQYRDWEMFLARNPLTDKDDPYSIFWNRFGDTTEENSSDKILDILAYHRPIIHPEWADHQRYLQKQPDGGFLARDEAGMVTYIELKTGEKCNRRVCRYCHNPLPDGYGKDPVKFVTVVGVTGSGKTVWLAQLLKKMHTYAANVSLSATTDTQSIDLFRKKNIVRVGEVLPSGTPFKQFQQPLFYGIVGKDETRGRWTETFVLYDVAGELFTKATSGEIDNFAPFIRHADGIIVLIDPLQIDVISSADDTNEAAIRDLPPAVKALGAIHNIVAEGDKSRGCTKPVAVCLSQIDRAVVQAVLSDDLKQRLRQDVQPIRDPATKYPLPIYNALEHAFIREELEDFMVENQFEVVDLLNKSYSDHEFFAFTSLGCEVVKVKTGEKEETKPVGPITPRRIEEPLYWLFYKMGFIDTNEFPPCPYCGTSRYTYPLKDDEQDEIVRHGIFRRREVLHYTYGCSKCNHRW